MFRVPYEAMHMMSIVEQSCGYILSDIAVSANYQVVHDYEKVHCLLNRSFLPWQKHPFKTRDCKGQLWKKATHG